VTARRVAVALAALAAVTLQAPVAAGPADPVSTQSLGDALADAEVASALAQAELDFTGAVLQSERRELLVLLIDDPVLVDCAVERCQALIEDRQLARRYGDQHPERLATAAAVDRSQTCIDERLDLQLVVLQHKLALQQALATELRRSLPDGVAAGASRRDAARAVAAADLRVRRLGDDVELREAQRLMDTGGVETLARLLEHPAIEVLAVARAAARRQDAEFAAVYGDRHPDRVSQATLIEDLDELLTTLVSAALDARALRLELLQAQIDVLGS
jgi:uncharacterized protein involved in exopolysaccharide biosynthesis